MARLDDLDPISQADWLATIEDLAQVYFTEVTGIKENFLRPQFADGLSARRRRASTGTVECEDVTLAAPLDPLKNWPRIEEWIKLHRDGTTQFSVLARPVRRNDDNTFQGNRALRLTGCRLASRGLADINTNSGDQAMTISIMIYVTEILFA